MPTIDLSNNNQTSTPQTSTPAPTNNAPTPINPPVQTTPMQMPNSGWNDPWGAPWGGGNNGGGTGDSKRLSPQERVTMIENAFNEILSRKPDTRDINYYKYSTLSEDEIKKQLITGNEHKQLLLDGRDYKKLKERALQAETRVKVLEGQIRDQVEEFRQLTDLLKEKNKYIQEIRERLNQALHTHSFKAVELPHPDVQVTQPHFTTPQSTFVKEEPKEDKKIKLIDRIKEIISDLL